MMVVTFWQCAIVRFNWFIYCVVCDMANKILSLLLKIIGKETSSGIKQVTIGTVCLQN